MSDEAKNTAVIYSLWYGLDYGSIISGYSLYEVLKERGFDPYLVGKPSALWNDSFGKKDTIPGRFIYENCSVLDIWNEQADRTIFDGAGIHIADADILWNYEVVLKQTGNFFLMGEAKDSDIKIAFGTSFGGPEAGWPFEIRYMR